MSQDGMRLTKRQQDLLEESVQELGLPVRVVNALEQQQIFTIEDLLRTPRSQLISTRNFGWKIIQQIFQALSEPGFVCQADSQTLSREFRTWKSLAAVRRAAEHQLSH